MKIYNACIFVVLFIYCFSVALAANPYDIGMYSIRMTIETRDRNILFTYLPYYSTSRPHLFNLKICSLSSIKKNN